MTNLGTVLLGIAFWSILKSEHANQSIAATHQFIGNADDQGIVEARTTMNLELDEQRVTEAPSNSRQPAEPDQPGGPTGATKATETQQFAELSGHSTHEDSREIGESSGLARPANSEEQPLICEFSGHVSIQSCVQPQISPWNFLRLLWIWFAVVLFTGSHLFIVIMLCFYTKTPDGTSRRTQVEFLPTIVLLVCGLGLLYGIYILLVSWDFHFGNPINPNNSDGRITKHRQGWKFKYPMVFFISASNRRG